MLANYQQVKISAPPNLNEPIGFDQLPDGRLIQTTRDGRVRLHDPATGEVHVIATIPVYTVNEDGLYGPAVDNDFATNRWVYLFYSPINMEPPYPATTLPAPPRSPAPTRACGTRGTATSSSRASSSSRARVRSRRGSTRRASRRSSRLR